MPRFLNKKRIALFFGFLILLGLPFTIIRDLPVEIETDTRELNPYKEPEDPAAAYLHKASDNYFYREFDAAADNYMKAIAIFEDRQDWPRVATTYESLGDLYVWANRSGDAEKSYLTAVKFHTQNNDVLGQATALKDIADMYSKLENLEESESWYLKSLAVLKEEKINRVFGNVHENLGQLYWKMERTTEAMESFMHARDTYGALNYRMGYDHMENVLKRLQRGGESTHNHNVPDSVKNPYHNPPPAHP
ncbi:tetratricopeptide repeat protein [Nitrospina gracilis]|uniref:tetratricopeptide repeat protein n=1 Tax=Nitrospina gracilis TaxID=35801 RepID=UPI001F278E48|nr:tetratricopeptide repeat protein [Nitrospina gracilis]MCF8721312.1 tetratricopeptide (TPR) repeat protein [Nitrospina gracilis Nb-211]